MKLLMPRMVLALAMGWGLSACKPELPPADKPVEPQVSALTATMQEPLARAAAVEGELARAAERQKAAVEAAAH